MLRRFTRLPGMTLAMATSPRCARSYWPGAISPARTTTAPPVSSTRPRPTSFFPGRGRWAIPSKRKCLKRTARLVLSQRSAGWLASSRTRAILRCATRRRPLSTFPRQIGFHQSANASREPRDWCFHNGLQGGWHRRERALFFAARPGAAHCLLSRVRSDSIKAQMPQENREIGAFTTVCRVVGIVENARYSSLRDPAPPTVYFPASTSTVGRGSYNNNLVFLIRSQNARDAISAYRAALARFAPNTGYMTFLPLTEQVDQSIGSERLIARLSG